MARLFHKMGTPTPPLPSGKGPRVIVEFVDEAQADEFRRFVEEWASIIVTYEPYSDPIVEFRDANIVD